MLHIVHVKKRERGPVPEMKVAERLGDVRRGLHYRTSAEMVGGVQEEGPATFATSLPPPPPPPSLPKGKELVNHSRTKTIVSRESHL